MLDSTPSNLSKTKRLRILTPSELEDLYARPLLTHDQRIELFELNQEEQKLLTSPLSKATKVDAIIRLGFLRKKNHFFSFDLHEVPEDVTYILERYFELDTFDKNKISRLAKLNNQQWVLRLTGYQLFNQAQHEPILMNSALKLCQLSANPIFIFQELLTEITRQKITRPGYSTLQKIISSALITQQKRISQIFKEQLLLSEREKLFNLLDHTETFYAVTSLKKQPKNFKPTAIRQEINYYIQYQPLYEIAKRLLPLLEISKNGIAYCADLVEHYTVQSLSRINTDQTCLWLLCFIFHRCQRMLDNLATMFIYISNQYQEDVKKRAEALLLIHALSADEKNKALAKLIRVYTDKTINEKSTFKAIKKMVYATILPAERINEVADELDQQEQQKLYQSHFTWQAVDEFANTYRPLLRALLKILVLEGDQHKALQKAYQFLQAAFHKESSLSQLSYNTFPMQFISQKIRDFIDDSKNKKIITDRYEYECYRQLATYLNGRSLFLSNSIQYQSLTAALLPEWGKVKKKVLSRVNRPLLNHSLNQFIEEKAKPLDQKILSVNEAIHSGENAYVKVQNNKDGSQDWTLPYTKKSVELNNPFYEKLPLVNIIQVMQFVNEKTQFMRQLTHIKPHYAKSCLDEIATYACLIANGTNLGIIKMAGLCDINFENLQLTEKNYLRLATIRAANDIISNAIARLIIYKHWNLQPGLLHASLDGQKFITERENFIARNSKKYFGTQQGVVAYSLIANHLPVNTMIIGANEHESHFLFDLIYNNSSEIQPDIFSTDTEGSNKLNFLLLYLIERLYAPRYRSFGDRCESIISFWASGGTPQQCTL